MLLTMNEKQRANGMNRRPATAAFEQVVPTALQVMRA
jgi:hypothetical protein